MRARIKFRATLAGSSDPRRIRVARNILEENHKKNVAFFATIKATVKITEPADNAIVTVKCGSGYVRVEYSVVKAAGYKWSY